MASDDGKKSKDPESVGRSMAKAQPYIDAAWQFIGGVIVGSLGGIWLDRRFHTAPWLTVVGSFLGMAAGFVAFMRVLAVLDKKNKPKNDSAPKDGL